MNRFAQKTIAVGELPPLFSAIEVAMQQAGHVTEEAAGEHWRAFAWQMREKLGVDEITLEEPYLPGVLARASLEYLQKLERLFDPLEDEAEEEGAEDEYEETDGFNFSRPLLPQLQARLALEEVQHRLAVKQELDSIRQPAFGIRNYAWRASADACGDCAAMDGEVQSWGEGGAPGGVHPNCRCSAEPVLEGAGEPADPPIEPVYVLETLLAGLATGVGRAVARTILGQLDGVELPPEDEPSTPKPEQTPKPEGGKEPPLGGRTDTEWKLGEHKSDAKWQNQMEKRGWGERKITDTIKNGKEYPAPNKVNPNNGATRYEKDGKFVVRDNKTREIIQIGDDGFQPNQL